MRRRKVIAIGFAVLAIGIASLIIALAEPVSYYSGPFKEGSYLLYRFDTSHFTVKFVDGTVKRYESVDNPWLRIEFLKNMDGKALVEVHLYYEAGDEPIDLTARCYVDLNTRDVFLINGTRIGKTMIWLPFNTLYDGSKTVVSECLGRRSARYILKLWPPHTGEQSILGWVWQYRCTPDPEDEESYIDVRKVVKLVMNGVEEGDCWKAINITQGSDGSIVFWLQLYRSDGKPWGRYGPVSSKILESNEGWLISRPPERPALPQPSYDASTGVAVSIDVLDGEPLLLPLKVERILSEALLVDDNVGVVPLGLRLHFMMRKHGVEIGVSLIAAASTMFIYLSYASKKQRRLEHVSSKTV